MAPPSLTTLTILLGFSAAFWCLDPLESIHTGKIQTSQQSPAARLAAAALPPAVLATFGLTLLLLITHVRALGRANVAGGRLLGRLDKATLTATVTALIAGAVLRLVADGHLGGADDVGWLDMQ
ncbi:hypothetical protein BAE44_0010913 [Dichanthelium oligosanthes]|uniref:Uncharacterized protein n=1 Tax=Dichanthelium oligosanthes TaxID=888268 RepID=A0A1E5VSI3_9POAL|nr:hypothetical protein BAE44_0010913 [Dichanthelium oligosanthes]